MNFFNCVKFYLNVVFQFSTVTHLVTYASIWSRLWVYWTDRARTMEILDNIESYIKLSCAKGTKSEGSNSRHLLDFCSNSRLLIYDQ